MAESSRLNGINTQALRKSIQEIERNPGTAVFTFRAKSTWLGGTHCRTAIKSFLAAGKEDTSRRAPFVLEGDEPGVLLGDDNGPNATEALLHALGACLSVTLMYHAALRGVRIDSLDIELDGDLDLRGILGLSDKVRNGFENIRVVFRVGSDAPRASIEELCRLAQSYSPVADTVLHPTPISARVEVLPVGQAGGDQRAA
jgi:uncharacterized OsmC-like protein